jgi:hypothetical protein
VLAARRESGDRQAPCDGGASVALEFVSKRDSELIGIRGGELLVVDNFAVAQSSSNQPVGSPAASDREAMRCSSASRSADSSIGFNHCGPT